MKKRVSTMGRIGIPKEIRDDMGLCDGDFLFMDYSPKEKKITLTKDGALCTLCQGTENLLKLKENLFLCPQCLNRLNQKAKS